MRPDAPSPTRWNTAWRSAIVVYWLLLAVIIVARVVLFDEVSGG